MWSSPSALVTIERALPLPTPVCAAMLAAWVLSVYYPVSLVGPDELSLTGHCQQPNNSWIPGKNVDTAASIQGIRSAQGRELDAIGHCPEASGVIAWIPRG